jgi:hypothetical protein
MRALQIYAGPVARAHLQKDGLQPQDIGTVPGAAGGPKGLILGPLDRYIFGEWLATSMQPVHLVGASIGAWRMATACLNDPAAALSRLEHDYIHQHFPAQAGQKRPGAAFVSELFGRNLRSFFAGRIGEILNHPRYRLHIVTSRGRHLLGREHPWRTPLGYVGAFLANAVHRPAMGALLERVVFSTQQAVVPFDTRDYRTQQVDLSAVNFESALQASCSIPFVLQAVHDIPGAPHGAYWDGGLTDYHMHLNYAAERKNSKIIASESMDTTARGKNGLVLYPHFQNAVVPGWLDKHLTWRHKSTHFLDTMILLAPNPEWIKTLPHGKLPDRTDFTHYGHDLAGRVKAWTTATSASTQLADEFAAWLQRPDMARVQPL